MPLAPKPKGLTAARPHLDMAPASDRAELSLLPHASVKAARSHFPASIDALVEEGFGENQWWSSDPPGPVQGKPNHEANSITPPQPPSFRAAAPATAGDPPAAAALLFCDLDRFKTVNDSLGHHAGDQLLHEVAARLSDLLDPNHLLVRLGG